MAPKQQPHERHYAKRREPVDESEHEREHEPVRDGKDAPDTPRAGRDHVATVDANMQLREALAPFAAAARQIGNEEDGWPLNPHGVGALVTVGHLREALRVLSEVSMAPSDG